MKEIINLGNRIEMFVDEYMIDYSHNVSMKMANPEKKEIVITFDKPWEGRDSYYPVVFKDKDKVKLYYRGFMTTDTSDDQVVGYAESSDGKLFERPEIGLYEFNGKKNNNIVYIGEQGHNFAPFMDLNPQADREEKYKAIGGAEGAVNPQLNKGMVYGFVSSDGIRWKKVRDEPVLTKGQFDSQNIVFWDVVKKCYVCYSRYFAPYPDGRAQVKYCDGIRSIQTSTSNDFINWDDPAPHMYGAGDPIEEFYTNATVQCPGAPHFYLSFPKRFIKDRQRNKAHPHPGVSDAVFMSSRDGIHWDRTFKEAWIRPGLDIDNWSDRNNMPAHGIIETSEEEFSMYVMEHYDAPDCRLRRYSIRKHGFASVNAGWKEGEFITRPVRFDRGSLNINFSTSAAGYIRVEVQDVSGRVIQGFGAEDMDCIYGDSCSEKVLWNDDKDIGMLAGQTVRLRFIVKDADIYSFYIR